MMINKVVIIAEAGVNHNGSLSMAKELINAAAEAGADIVKFQTFKSEQVISKYAPKAAYQTETTDKNESQLDMVKKLELTENDHFELVKHCQLRNIEFLSTPFDLESVDFLAKQLDVRQIKIPSGEITNAPLLLKAARTGKPIILSTGMSTLAEIEIALGILAFGYLHASTSPSLGAFHKAFCSPEGQKALKDNIVLLHCTTEYPAPFHDVNLRAMETMRNAFGLPVGFSDHTVGIAIPIAAAARGAAIIEKHFTLDRTLPGPDHKASIEPTELKKMVLSIRQVEESLGNSCKIPAPSEVANKDIARKSIVAVVKIKSGETFAEKNLTVKRPGSGISPLYYWEMMGKIAKRDYEEDEALD
jgi:N-acetylneuraminate synthase